MFQRVPSPRPPLSLKDRFGIQSEVGVIEAAVDRVVATCLEPEIRQELARLTLPLPASMYRGARPVDSRWTAPPK